MIEQFNIHLVGTYCFKIEIILVSGFMYVT